jgi:mannan endo-1,4-beta-mannosidase
MQKNGGGTKTFGRLSTFQNCGWILCVAVGFVLVSGCSKVAQISDTLPLTQIKGSVLLEGQSAHDGIAVEVYNQNVAAQTQASGEFSISGLQPGNYSLVLSKSSYVSKRISVTVPAAGEINLGAIELLARQKSYRQIQFSIPGQYFGVFAVDSSVPSISSRIAQYVAVARGKPVLTGIFVPFLTDSKPISANRYVADLKAIAQAGSVPYITWEPWDPNRGSESIMADIVSGKYDALIDDWAAAIRSLDVSVVIRFAHEMNGGWYPWSSDPRLYKQVFQYVVDRFRSNKTMNVSWVFAPNRDDGGTGRNYQDYYPGDRFVDCVGISGYNWGDTQPWSRWTSFRDTFLDMVVSLSRYNMPILLDTGCTESGSTTESKADWIQNMHLTLATDARFSLVKGVVWFQANKETDWRINSSDASAKAYATGLEAHHVIATPVTSSLVVDRDSEPISVVRE